MLSAFALAALLAGCGGNPEDDIDEAVVVLDRSIASIDQRSLRWQSVLEESGDELRKRGQSGIADEMSEAIGRFLGDLNTAAHCRPDFVHNRLRDDLIRLRAQLTEEELQLSPVFCYPNPNVVRFTDVQDGSVDSVEISVCWPSIPIRSVEATASVCLWRNGSFPTLTPNTPSSDQPPAS